MDASDVSLGTLGKQLQALDTELRSCEIERDELDQQIKTATAGEDAEGLATAWAQKRTATERMAELWAHRHETSRDWRAAIEREVAALHEQDDEGRERLQGQQREHVAELGRLFERARQVLGELDQLPAEWLRQQQAARAKLEQLLKQAIPESSERRPMTGGRRPSSGSPVILGDETGKPSRTALRSAKHKDAHRQPWKVYDPDAGKIVETLEDLRKVLVRWYPGRLSEQERLHRFFQITDADTMPERLRQELREVGYVADSSSCSAVTEDVVLSDRDDRSIELRKP